MTTDILFSSCPCLNLPILLGQFTRVIFYALQDGVTAASLEQSLFHSPIGFVNSSNLRAKLEVIFVFDVLVFLSEN